VVAFSQLDEGVRMINRAMAGAADAEKGEQVGLPYQEPLKTWASRGTGALCSLCGASITAQDIEYEAELLAPSGSSRELHFHFNCYVVWETQSRS
jgi:hypothetical protein